MASIVVVGVVRRKSALEELRFNRLAVIQEDMKRMLKLSDDGVEKQMDRKKHQHKGDGSRKVMK